MVETFICPIAIYGLRTIVYREKDNNNLFVVQNNDETNDSRKEGNGGKGPTKITCCLSSSTGAMKEQTYFKDSSEDGLYH